MNLLSVEQLNISIGKVNVCEQLTLEVQAGTCWGILGANGTGKTTLLHTLAGLRPAASGNIFFRGKHIQQIPGKQLASELGLLLQNKEQGLSSSVLESALSGRHPHLGRWGWETGSDIALAKKSLLQVGLEGLDARSSNTLSGGEHRRMEIASLLTQAPKLALLDEPGNHLDPGQQISILKHLQKRFTQADHALVMVMHDINSTLRFCDHLLLLQGDGQWLAGATEEVATEATLSALYQYPIKCIHTADGDLFFPE